MATKINFVGIYSLHDEIDADVIEKLLDGFNIVCMVRPPGPGAGRGPERSIAVEEDSSESARRLIAEAERNGIISKEGKFRV